MMWRGAVAVPNSCPLPSLTYESNSWSMKYRVYSKILNLVKHIHSQDEKSNLSKQVMTQQIQNAWPGLCQLAQKICDELNISELFDTQISKKQFKIIVKKVCQQDNEDL